MRRKSRTTETASLIPQRLQGWTLALCQIRPRVAATFRLAKWRHADSPEGNANMHQGRQWPEFPLLGMTVASAGILQRWKWLLNGSVWMLVVLGLLAASKTLMSPHAIHVSMLLHSATTIPQAAQQ